jgi:prepilin-type N-terminal cleavage/methylation domain-containing protein
MKNNGKQCSGACRSRSHSGFTLIELMIAMGVFLVIASAAVSLFRSHANLFGDQQGVVVLNVSLRNALSQIETDAVQAGNGFFGALSTANSPVGITIVNTAGPFDQMYAIQAASPAVQLDPASGCALSTTSGNAILAATAGVTTAQFPANTEVLFMNQGGNQMTVVRLQGSTAGAGGKINLQYYPTNGNGTNSSSNDPFGLTATPTQPQDPDQITASFCPTNGDYVVPLSYVKYSVNGQNQLIRETAANAGVGDVIAEQVIGFKVGAATFQNAGGISSTPSYTYDPTQYGSKFSYIRSIRVSLVGRTPPGQFSGSTFKNSYDGGSYKIQSLSLVVNPRNLSMND